MIRTDDADLGDLGRLIKVWANSQRFPPNQAAIAKELGVSQQTISNWMRGNFKVPMKPTHLRSIVKMMADDARPMEDVHMDALEAMLRDSGMLPKSRLRMGDARRMG